MPTEGSTFRAVAFGLWAIQFGVMMICELILGALFSRGGLIVSLSTLVALPLEAFLIFKSASNIPSLAPSTAQFNRFFYESRDSAMALPVLSILWLLCLFLTGGLALVDLMSGGPLNMFLGALAKSVSPLIAVIATLLCYVGMVYYLPLMGWMIWTGGRAMVRVVKLRRGPDEEAGVGLMSKDDDGVWNEYQGDGEMRA
ncbi:hypothetical protein ACJ41O_001929 [Fusarium nematophilum]